MLMPKILVPLPFFLGALPIKYRELFNFHRLSCLQFCSKVKGDYIVFVNNGRKKREGNDKRKGEGEEMRKV